MKILSPLIQTGAACAAAFLLLAPAAHSEETPGTGSSTTVRGVTGSVAKATRKPPTTDGSSGNLGVASRRASLPQNGGEEKIWTDYNVHDPGIAEKNGEKGSPKRMSANEASAAGGLKTRALPAPKKANVIYVRNPEPLNDPSQRILSATTSTQNGDAEKKALLLAAGGAVAAGKANAGEGETGLPKSSAKKVVRKSAVKKAKPKK